MTDIREHVEKSLSERREGGANLQTSGIFLSMSAILELYEKLDTLSKSEQAGARYLREHGWDTRTPKTAEALDKTSEDLDKNAKAISLVRLLRGDVEPEPEHEP